jgi:hypothetical protein
MGRNCALAFIDATKYPLETLQHNVVIVFQTLREVHVSRSSEEGGVQPAWACEVVHGFEGLLPGYR